MTFKCLQCEEDYEPEHSPSDLFCGQYCSERWTRATTVKVERADKERDAEARRLNNEFEDAHMVPPIMTTPRGMGMLWAYARHIAQQAELSEPEEEEDPDGV